MIASIVSGTSILNRQTLCEVHAKIMRNLFLEDRTIYVPPGSTRTTTGRSVFTAGQFATQFSPYHLVDDEVDLITQVARVAFSPFSLGGFPLLIGPFLQWYIAGWRNPFAVASWLHCMLANCHPFNVSELHFV